MEKYYLQTVGTPIVSEHGERLGRIGDVILNTETGKVVGFFVAPGKKVISPVDVLSWPSYVKIHDSHDIVEIDEVIQISRVLEKKITIHRSKVMTKSGDYIGRVIDFGIDDKFFALTCLVVAKGFLGLIFWDKKIIAAVDILEITEKAVIIKDLVRPVKMKKLKLATPTP